MAGYVLTWSFRKTKVIKWKERKKEKKNLTLIFRSLHWLWLKFSFYACRLLLPRNIWLVFFIFFFLMCVQYISSQVNAQRVCDARKRCNESVLLLFSGFIIYITLFFRSLVWIAQHWPLFSCICIHGLFFSSRFLIRTLIFMIYIYFNTSTRCIYDFTHSVCCWLNSIWLFVWISLVWMNYVNVSCTKRLTIKNRLKYSIK